MSALILIIALLLAGAATWCFFQGGTPTIKDRIKKIVDKIEKEIGEKEKQDLIEINDLDTMTATEIQDKKKEIEKILASFNFLKTLTKEQIEKLDEEKKKILTNFPVVLPLTQEVLTLTEKVKTGADFSKKSPYLTDYALTGGVGLAVFFLCAGLFSKFFGIMKTNENQ